MWDKHTIKYAREDKYEANKKRYHEKKLKSKGRIEALENKKK